MANVTLFVSHFEMVPSPLGVKIARHYVLHGNTLCIATTSNVSTQVCSSAPIRSLVSLQNAR